MLVRRGLHGACCCSKRRLVTAKAGTASYSPERVAGCQETVMYTCQSACVMTAAILRCDCSTPRIGPSSSICHHPLLITMTTKHALTRRAGRQSLGVTTRCTCAAACACCVHQRAKPATHRTNKTSLLLLLLLLHTTRLRGSSAGCEVVEKHVTRFLCQRQWGCGPAGSSRV